MRQCLGKMEPTFPFQGPLYDINLYLALMILINFFKSRFHRRIPTLFCHFFRITASALSINKSLFKTGQEPQEMQFKMWFYHTKV